ncbi:heme biosynthesis protein HemY [Methylobacterium aerolatum]|uniref:HemY protein n=1 Tax=Methylobacterium aerolatum TaxID=418708 RepID=A0ABU0I1S6_9HYPH|nr:heme biosynthesis HemY N-terminal domain-containing protein [Methylobacterium aerolatum]MDQ0448047.1 HemY protein [Methylobacterium aerolatum]GJD36482.1 Lipopolysaccharide assembly protein B [Methylobacterium aerolatum]
MWRALAYLVLLAVAAFGAVWIADRPGTVTVVWNGYQIGTSLSLAIVGVIAAAIVLGLVWAILRGVINLPEALVRGSAERRRSKGLSALSRGMVAVGSGDPLAARRYANDAERLLGAEPLTLLLKAQAAQISGDRDGAEQAFRAMVDDSETRVLGLRGLFVEARRREDEEAARAYATEAARLAPSVTWANDAVLEAHCADTDWAAALETVERRASLGLIDKAQAKRQRAVLLTAIAREREAGEPEAATTRALEAIKLAPGLVPAACLAGRLLARRGDLKKAARAVEGAWRINPHPDLAKVYLNLRTGDSVRDRLTRAETLAKLSAWDPEARLAVAQAALDAREFARAREALQPLLADRPTARTCLTMAAIEEAEHGAQSGRTREWFARAARAPRDPIWIADGVASETWEPVSPLTGQLDAFVWQAPPSAIGVSPEPEPAEPLETPALVPARAQAGPDPMGLKPVEIAAGAPVPAEPKLVGVKPADLKPVTAGATAKGDTSAPDPVSAGMAAAALPVPEGPVALGAPPRETAPRSVKLVP